MPQHQIPPQNSPADCRQEYCINGGVISLPNDLEKSAQDCRECKSGAPAPSVDGPNPKDTISCCFQGAKIANTGLVFSFLTARCPGRLQNKKAHEFDGCTWSPDDLESWDNLPGTIDYHLYVTNPIWGTLTPSETLPCNRHDICYQRCGSDKTTCDAALGQGVTASCDIGYPMPCMRTDQAECPAYEEEYLRCREIGATYVSGTTGSVPDIFYREKQTLYCNCCRPE